MNYTYMPQYENDNYSNLPVPKPQACSDPRACKLKVEGKGSVKVRPDMAVVILEVITENKQLQTAQEENTAKVNAVLASLRENGIPLEDIQTQSFNVAPQYDFIEGKQVFRGYRVIHSLEVTIREMAGIGKIIDEAVQSGVNQVSNIKFSIANPSTYYQKALNAAVDDALAKARALGNKLKIVVSNVPVQIVEMRYETDAPIPFMYQASAAATPVQTGLIDISARIEAVFAYRPTY